MREFLGEGFVRGRLCLVLTKLVAHVDEDVRGDVFGREGFELFQDLTVPLSLATNRRARP